jgi:hypothetical protein
VRDLTICGRRRHQHRRALVFRPLEHTDRQKLGLLRRGPERPVSPYRRYHHRASRRHTQTRCAPPLEVQVGVEAMALSYRRHRRTRLRCLLHDPPLLVRRPGPARPFALPGSRNPIGISPQPPAPVVRRWCPPESLVDTIATHQLPTTIQESRRRWQAAITGRSPLWCSPRSARLPLERSTTRW